MMISRDWENVNICARVKEERIGDYKINVIGEYTYTSLKEARNTITLRLHKNHYTVAKKKLNFVKGIAYTEKIPVIYKYNPNDPFTVRLYNGKGYSTISYEDFKQKKYKECITSPYIFIKNTKPTMKETYDDFIFKADNLKKHTNGNWEPGK